MGGQNYSIELHTYGDESLGDTVPELFPYLATADFLLGGTTDLQTGAVAGLAQSTGQVMTVGIGGFAQIFQNHPSVFGMLPEYSRYFAAAVDTLASVGARTVGIVVETEPYAQTICSTIPSYAAALGMSVGNSITVSCGRSRAPGSKGSKPAAWQGQKAEQQTWAVARGVLRLCDGRAADCKTFSILGAFLSFLSGTPWYTLLPLLHSGAVRPIAR